jgi:hypothetical protein
MTGELAAAITSLKAAADIAKALVGLRDTAMIQSKVIELQGEIMSAQSGALAAQQAQSALLDRVRSLEKEVADLKAWDTEKEKYQLTQIGLGVFAYALKDQAGASEPKHFLCPNCYEDGRKAILQKETRYPGMVDVLTCLRCGSEINMTGNASSHVVRTKPAHHK